MARAKKEVHESERCESVRVEKMKQRRCAQRAIATVTHPDLRRPWRVCRTHARDYNSAIQSTMGWSVRFDPDPKRRGAE